MSGRATDRWTYVLGLFAVGNLVNAAWMLATPTGWYANIPGRVPDFGPMNEHFIRDIGCLFLIMGIGLAWAAVRERARVPLLALVTAWYGAHAVVHVYDTLRGLVGPDHWGQDLPGVYVPALLLIAVTVAVARTRPSPA